MICPICGKEFTPHVHNQKYCGAEECRKIVHREEQRRYIEKKGGNQYRRELYRRNREKFCLQQKVCWIKRRLKEGA